MKTWIIGDIHGELIKLSTLLNEVGFSFQEDRLISLGDVVDRGPDSRGCVDLLLKCKNLIAIRGNHDDYFYSSVKNNQLPGLWSQGASQTYDSYGMIPGGENKLPESHIEFFENQLDYYKDEDNNVFVHGGFNRHYLLTEQKDPIIFSWDRDLFMEAVAWEMMVDKSSPFKIKEPVNEVFVGHTPTTYWGISTPFKAANITNLDTGCGKGGLLTIMDLETKEYYQI